jgi:rhodanese-related sulfurtransferase/rubrerythrin
MPSPVSFQEIPAWTVDQVRTYLREHDPDDFTLLDVRQPEEYTEGHLPGSRLIPVGELNARIGEVPRTESPTIVYCRSGMRAGKATAMLLQAGFREVWNMTGGILAWNGLTATGEPEAGMSWFETSDDPAETVALAWILERGAQIFYEHMAGKFSGSDAGELFRSLAKAEEHHKAGLKTVHESLTGNPGDPVPQEEVEARDTMEGGMSIRRALEWAEHREPLDVLEFAAAMEVNAFDRYQQVARSLVDPISREVLERLALEEKEHLDRLMKAFVQLGKKGFLG